MTHTKKLIKNTCSIDNLRISANISVMNLYAFELGRMKDLCAAELMAVLKDEKLVDKNFDTAIFEMDLEKPQKLQNKLGGNIKIIEIFSKVSTKQEIEPAIQNFLEKEFADKSGKIQFSISILNFKRSQEPNIKHLLNFSKKILKSLGLNSRFVNKGPFSPKSSTIYKAKVIRKGVDINLIQGENAIYIGKAVAIQNIDAYSKRDFDKPKRDARVGMLPPKLSQIMINLAGEDTKTIYDPFCGTGTLLMEALLMGKDAVGSDIEERLVDYSNTNLTWFEKEFETSNAYRTFISDAQLLTKELLPEKIDAVVTEGYLGTPFSREPDSNTIQQIFAELSNLHFAWLKCVHRLTPPQCKVVMCLTAYQTKKGVIHMTGFEELAKKAGYKISKNFTYRRKDQFVIRDILILEKI